MEDDNGKGRGEKHKDNVDGIRALTLYATKLCEVNFVCLCIS